MLRILHTGDLHLGREYKRQMLDEPAVAERYRSARLEALKNVVRLAGENDCDFLVIAGDLFDSRTVPAALLKSVCADLGECPCPVLVLPGNHDYCEGEGDRLWSGFRDCAAENTILLARAEPVALENAVFYPCPCGDRYSESNALGWLRDGETRDPARVHIGVAHGALEGLSCDREKRYYCMTRRELESCGMDLWLLGHTHVPFPDLENVTGERIFNAGTPQQTDIADNAAGTAFLINVDEQKNVTARRVHTGVLRFAKVELHIARGQALRGCLEAAAKPFDPENSSLRIEITGTVCAADYAARQKIYEELGKPFLKFDVRDETLRQEIDAEMIDAETLEGSVENRLLKRYIGEPEMLDLAFSLVKKCREAK